jgi:ubiquinone/menaquinone biosynthesis C-methylase UbiE
VTDQAAIASAVPREGRSPGPRRLSRPARLTLGLLAASASVGLLASLYAWLTLEPDIGAPRPAVVLAGVGVAVVTMANLLLRFLRWQYLLRRFGVRVAAPESLGAFVGSFAFLPIPLYLGQLIARARLVTDVRGPQRGYLLLAFLWERALDLWALVALYAVLAAPVRVAGLAAAALVLVPGVRRILMRVARAGAAYLSRLLFEAPVVFERDVTELAARGSVFAVSALLSVAAWTVVVLSIVPLATMAGVTGSVAAEGAAAARSILVGAVSLVPLGFGVSGLTLAGDLGALTSDPVAGTHITLIFRAATAWLTVGIGAVALVALRRWREREATHDHFDAIDECYDTWLPVHFRAHVVAKKTEPMIAALGGHLPGARGLDIGCGRGWYLRALRDGGALMTGLDTSALQLEAAREYLGPAAPLVRATMLALPFGPKSFEFAYVINVLHHLPPERQLEALGQVASVVSPSGLVFVHEMNSINPLFRFYLGYVFPILKGIEEGVETYLDPRQIENVPGLELMALHFFSFMPDFVPAGLLGVLKPVERRLERSRLARFSAHFLAIYRRTAASPGPAAGPAR